MGGAGGLKGPEDCWLSEKTTQQPQQLPPPPQQQQLPPPPAADKQCNHNAILDYDSQGTYGPFGVFGPFVLQDFDRLLSAESRVDDTEYKNAQLPPLLLLPFWPSPLIDRRLLVAGPLLIYPNQMTACASGYFMFPLIAVSAWLWFNGDWLPMHVKTSEPCIKDSTRHSRI